MFADVTSGSEPAIERPGMKKLLEYAQEGDAVVVGRVDRLGRSLIDVLNTVTLLRDRGVHVQSIADGIDPATSTGRMMLNMLATLAEYERELIIERVNAGMAAARQNGTHFGRSVSARPSSRTSWRSPRTPARRDEPPKTPPASSAGAAQRSTATNKPSLHTRAPQYRCP
ncbi:Resolvase, N terminal domain [Arthrobacter sp. ok909]|nr:Resolvase, N terminal domain [Arthrobacter sp. ok909]